MFGEKVPLSMYVSFFPADFHADWVNPSLSLCSAESWGDLKIGWDQRTVPRVKILYLSIIDC